MARYINADRIDMNQVTVYDYKEQKWTHIFDIPEDIVRCKECIHYIRNIPCVGGSYNGCEMIEGQDGNEYEINNESFYCGYGERRQDAKTN